MRRLRRGPIPNVYEFDRVFALRRGIVFDLDRFDDERVRELCCRAVPGVFWIGVVHLLRVGVITGRNGIAHERMCVVFGRQVRIKRRLIFLRRLRCRKLQRIRLH